MIFFFTLHSINEHKNCCVESLSVNRDFRTQKDHSVNSFRRGFYRTVHTEVKTSRRSPGTVEEVDNKVYVAVGKSFEKAVVLLQWACRTFGNSEICILHVHKLSPLIPTPVGRLPASQANAEVESAFRNREREAMRQRLYNYLNVCWQFKEIMYDPLVAADGFTYEGDAIRGWLGRKWPSYFSNDQLETKPLRANSQQFIAPRHP